MCLVKSQRHETLYCMLMYTKCLQRIAISLVGLYLAQRSSLHGRGHTDPCVDLKYNALDGSLDFQNYQKTTVLEVKRCIIC